MSRETAATMALRRAGLGFDLHEYDYVAGGHQIGLQAAAAIGADPDRVFKTLMIELDGRPACVVIPVARELSMKKAAAALGGKSAQMMPPAKAERMTGFHVGGISPFGQKRAVPVAIDESAFGFDRVILNGGRRGLMVELAPAPAAEALAARRAPLCA